MLGCERAPACGIRASTRARLSAKPSVGAVCVPFNITPFLNFLFFFFAQPQKWSSLSGWGGDRYTKMGAKKAETEVGTTARNIPALRYINLR